MFLSYDDKFKQMEEGGLSMELNEYQNEARKFAKYKDPMYTFNNLAAEAGEVLGKIAKIQRGDYDDDKSLIVPSEAPLDYVKFEEETIQEAIMKELGDVLWQLSACCIEVGTDLETVAQMNLDKLTARKKKNVINGEGDDR